MKTKQESLDVLVFVEKDEADRLKIRSDQLEQIGHKLRGFSVFNSVILPLMVSVATVFFTGLFQNISWTNEVRLREATEIANRAMNVSEKVSAAINQRKYATYTFIGSLRDLVLVKINKLKRLNAENANDQLNRPDITTGARVSGDVDPAQSLPKPASPTPAIHLSALDSDLGKKRFKNYYEQLEGWNEGIAQLVTDLDYALDRPIFIQADVTPPSDHKGINDYWGQLEDMNCLSSLPKELKRKGFDAKHLKMRLIGIHYCFMQLNALLRGKKAAEGAELSWDDVFHDEVHKRLDYIDYMGNELRCYALHRVDYYNSLKVRSIISPWSALNNVMNEQKADADRHFEDAAKDCDPEKRREAARAAAAAKTVASGQRPTQTLH
jgi:hypothetical protein